jgi:hypothetical protein
MGQHKQNKFTQISMPQIGFEPTTSTIERTKTVHALDSSATVIGIHLYYAVTFPIINLTKRNLGNTSDKRFGIMDGAVCDYCYTWQAHLWAQSCPQVKIRGILLKRLLSFESGCTSPSYGVQEMSDVWLARPTQKAMLLPDIYYTSSLYLGLPISIVPTL